MKNQIFAGLGLGILVGFIIGLSASEVVGLILGALVSLLAAFFGLREKRGDDTVNYPLIGAFGIFCVIGIVFGIYSRTHQLLSPTLAEKYAEYEKLKFLDNNDKKEAFFASEFGILKNSNDRASKDIKEKTDNTSLTNGYKNLKQICKADTLNIVKDFKSYGMPLSMIIDSLTANEVSLPTQNYICKIIRKIICSKCQ